MRKEVVVKANGQMHSPARDMRSGKGDSRPTDLLCLNGVFSVFILFGLVVAGVLAVARPQTAVALMWAIACLGVGAFCGLLFGIPRMRQKPQSGSEGDNEQRYQPEINNNLIEVSDWVTKIIVGLGLVELRSIPSKLKELANPLALALGSDGSAAIAAGLIVFFTSA